MNDASFQQFYIDCYAYCLPYLIQLTASKVDAEDCLQEAITKYWLYLQQGKLKHQVNLKAFVLTIARNYWINRQKQKGRIIPTAPEQLYDQMNAHLNRQEAVLFDHLVQQEEAYDRLLKQKQRIMKFRQSWKQLSGRCQNLLLQRIVYRTTPQEMTETFGFSNKRVTITSVSRCKQKLKKIFQQKGGIP